MGDVGYISTPAVHTLVPWGGVGREGLAPLMSIPQNLQLCRYSSMLRERAVELEVVEGEEE